MLVCINQKKEKIKSLLNLHEFNNNNDYDIEKKGKKCFKLKVFKIIIKLITKIQNTVP